MFFDYSIDLVDVLIVSVIPLAAIGLALFANHSVYAILGLIATFVWAALCVAAVAHFEFISLLFIIIYVGAIAVLFIFIVMMIPSAQLRQRTNWLLVAVATGAAVITAWTEAGALFKSVPALPTIQLLPTNDISIFGALYTTWGLPLVLVAFILMVTLFGAIILTGQASLEGQNSENNS
jgi:NADH:ubiquinone oxidoreductase subunit 6 (subunit J)